MLDAAYGGRKKREDVAGPYDSPSRRENRSFVELRRRKKGI